MSFPGPGITSEFTRKGWCRDGGSTTLPGRCSSQHPKNPPDTQGDPQTSNHKELTRRREPRGSGNLLLCWREIREQAESAPPPERRVRRPAFPSKTGTTFCCGGQPRATKKRSRFYIAATRRVCIALRCA